MTGSDRLQSIFAAALEIESEQQRQRYLDETCAGDAVLREKVAVLLQAHEQAGSFLNATELEPTVAQTEISECVGMVVGPYKLLEQIGEGGMGIVFRAEQIEPVRREVALKVIKPGMDTKQVIARFEAERQALALMDHPHIARVLDAGATETGRPYFVMELVKGLPITKYCDRQQLQLPERLNLFADVCVAVQHAHQKGIIHRDIKPSNVLVTTVDGQPQVKVIDFGVAKATLQRLTDKTLFTGFLQIVGTPLYMSPEQVDQTSQDVDTRTDVYSLGVLLYELLTGGTPFDKSRIKQAAYEEFRRIIREEEPARPSLRLSTSTDTLPSIAALRGIEPKRLSAFVRGDLDWIVMKALEKDRERRYETASALAADISRYLHHEPVEASPPSAMYRFKKFAQRNKATMTTTLLVVLALIAGTAVASWQAIEALHARDLADKRYRSEQQARKLANTRLQGEREARAEVEVQRQLALERQEQSEANYQRAFSVVERMLQRVGGRDLYAIPQMLPVQRHLLEDAVQFYEELIRERPNDPRVRYQAALTYVSLSNVYAYLRVDSQLRDDTIRKSVALAEQLSAEYPKESTYTALWLETNWCLTAAARSLPRDERVAILRRAIAIAKTLTQKHPEHAIYLSKLSNALGVFLKVTAPVEAEQLLRQAVSPLGPDSPEFDHLRVELAAFLADRGRFEEAEREYRLAIGSFEERLHKDPNSVWTRSTRTTLARLHQQLGNLLARTDRSELAEQELRQALQYARELRRDFPDTARYQSGLSSVRQSLLTLLHDQGQDDDALRILNQLIADGPNDPDSYQARGNFYYNQVKDYEKALADFDQVLELEPDNAVILNQVTKLYSEMKQYDKALAVINKIIELAGQKATSFHYRLRGDLHQKLGDVKSALRDYRKGYEIEPDNNSSIWRLTKTLCELDRYQEAGDIVLGDQPGSVERQLKYAELVRSYMKPTKAVDVFSELLVEYPKSSSYHRFRGIVRGDQGDFGAALHDLEKAVELLTKDGDPRTFVDRAKILVRFDRFDDAKADVRRAFEMAPGSTDVTSEAAILARSLSSRQPHEALEIARLAAEQADDWRISVALCEAELTLNHHEAALGHIERALQKQPRASWLYKRRADAEFGLGRYEDALASLRKSLELNPDELSALTWIWPQHVAACPDEAFRTGMINLATQVIESTDGNIRAYRARANHHLAQGNHELARQDLQHIMASEETQSYYSQYQLALLHLNLNDADTYRQTCEAMLAAFAESEKSIETHFTAWTCALAANALSDYSSAINLAERSVELQPKSAFNLQCLGAILFRAGRFDEALETLQTAAKSGDAENTSPLYGWYFLAMTHHKLGQAAEAKQWFDKADEETTKTLSEENSEPPPWNRRLTLELLQKETAALLNAPVRAPVPTPKTDPDKLKAAG